MTADLFAYKPETWMDQAACIGYNPEWWFPDDRGNGNGPADTATRQAKTICATCDVRALCADYAMRTEPGWTKHGIWGGLTADARRQINKKAS